TEAFRSLLLRLRVRVVRATRAVPSDSPHPLPRIQRAHLRPPLQTQTCAAVRSRAPNGCVVVTTFAPLLDRSKTPARSPASQSALTRPASPRHQRNLPSCSTRVRKSSKLARKSWIDNVSIIKNLQSLFVDSSSVVSCFCLAFARF